MLFCSTTVRFLIDHHTVTEARARGWEELDNGDLLNEAEAAGFDVLLTIKTCLAQIVAAVNAATPGSYTEVDIPD